MAAFIFFGLLAVLTVIANKKNVKCVGKRRRIMGGVCAGLAQRLSWTPILVRVLAVLAILVTGPFAIILYILLWITLPTED